MPTDRYKITCEDVFTHVVCTYDALQQIFNIDPYVGNKWTANFLGRPVTIEVDRPRPRTEDRPVQPRGRPPGGIEAMPRRSRMAAALATGEKGLSEASDD